MDDHEDQRYRPFVRWSLVMLGLVLTACGGSLIDDAGLDSSAEADIDAGVDSDVDENTDSDVNADGDGDIDAAIDADVPSDGEAGDADETGPPDDLARLTGTTGWQIYPGGGYRYGPSIVIDEEGTVHLWSCSPGSDGAWDFIRYRSSPDGGHSWSAESIALRPTPGARDALAACDPGVVSFGGWWYLAYTSTEDARGTDNDLYVARAAAPEGPYEKWNGASWGGDPQPIIVYEGDPDQYGIGEPSLVLTDRLYVYYTNADGSGHTDVATVEGPVGDDWPAHLSRRGPAITRRPFGEDSTDVKYVDALERFVGVATVERFGPNAGVAVYQSFDGLTFEPAVWNGARVQSGAHNIGLSGTREGHLDVGGANFVAYAYAPPSSSWGDWPTFLDPVDLGTTPRGAAVFGRVSSIVGGDPGEWSWSGPLAWDGDPATAWSSESHGATEQVEEWVWIDLGTQLEVRGATIVPRAVGYGFPLDFSLETSGDGSIWNEVPGEAQTGFPNPGADPVERLFSAPVLARYLRLHATRLGADDYGNHYLQLGELQAIVTDR